MTVKKLELTPVQQRAIEAGKLAGLHTYGLENMVRGVGYEDLANAKSDLRDALVGEAVGADPSPRSGPASNLVDALRALIKEQGFLKTLASSFVPGSIYASPSDC